VKKIKRDAGLYVIQWAVAVFAERRFFRASLKLLELRCQLRQIGIDVGSSAFTGGFSYFLLAAVLFLFLRWRCLLDEGWALGGMGSLMGYLGS